MENEVKEEIKVEEPKKPNLLKYFLFIIGVVFIIIIIAVFQTPINGNSLIFNDGMSLNPKECSYFNKTTLFYSDGCIACEETIKMIVKLQNENGRVFDIDYKNINKNETMSFIISHDYIISKIPTMVVNCSVYVGKKDIETYRKLLV
jgi:thiol-disulfide isomerase/thioredoxin